MVANCNYISICERSGRVAKLRDAGSRRKSLSDRNKLFYVLLRICFLTFNLAQYLVCRAILASNRSVSLKSYSKFRWRHDACHRSQGLVRSGNRLLIENFKTTPTSVVLSGARLSIDNTHALCGFVIPYRLLMFVEAPVSLSLFRRAPWSIARFWRRGAPVAQGRAQGIHPYE